MKIAPIIAAVNKSEANINLYSPPIYSDLGRDAGFYEANKNSNNPDLARGADFDEVDNPEQLSEQRMSTV